MPKKRRGRKKGNNDDDDDDEAATASLTSPIHNSDKKLSFKKRRELQQKAADVKRRSKQKCRLCGKQGHIRRECPGIEDGGRGESMYKTKGGAGSGGSQRKDSKRMGSKNRGQSGNKTIQNQFISFPDGFSTIIGSVHKSDQRNVVEREKEENEDEEEKHKNLDKHGDFFPLIDCSSSVEIIIQHIAKIRGFGYPDIDAIDEYVKLLSTQNTTNYAGVICQHVLKSNDPSWKHPRWLKKIDSLVYFVVGIEDCVPHSSVPDLVAAILSDPLVVGLFVQLDFRKKSKESQIQRLQTMCVAANLHNVPLQISIVGKSAASKASKNEYDPYIDAVRAFARCAIGYSNLSIHLSNWSGSSDTMKKLLDALPGLMIGMNGRVSFTKSVLLHACAYDLPLERLLLESGAPSCLPSGVAKLLGKNGINHSGLIPFVAQAIALQKTTKSRKITAIDVARVSSNNSLRVYSRLFPSLAPSEPEVAPVDFVVGAKCNTILGIGKIIEIRHDGSYKVELNWGLTQGGKGNLYSTLNNISLAV